MVSIWLDPGVLRGAAEAAVAPKSAMSVTARMAAIDLKGVLSMIPFCPFGSDQDSSV